MPVPTIKATPAAAASESVQPGNGSATDEEIIEGLHMTILTFPWLARSAFSAKFLEKVYVFGKPPIYLPKFSFMVSGVYASISLTIAATSTSGSYIFS